MIMTIQINYPSCLIYFTISWIQR